MRQYGYLEDDAGELQLLYDFPERVEELKEKISLVLKGCGCKKSRCLNRICKYRKLDQTCGTACRCVDCKNTVDRERGRVQEGVELTGVSGSVDIQFEDGPSVDELEDMEISIEEVEWEMDEEEDDDLCSEEGAEEALRFTDYDGQDLDDTGFAEVLKDLYEGEPEEEDIEVDFNEGTDLGDIFTDC